MRIGSKMHVFEGCYEEYKKRHDEIWPEMKAELTAHGYRNYSIFLDELTGDLFAYCEVDDPTLADDMANTPVCRKWWDYMKDVMETNPDNSPVSTPLKNVFYLA